WPACPRAAGRFARQHCAGDGVHLHPSERDAGSVPRRGPGPLRGKEF
ncbi:MAG: hypothetical protein AVDCRST_MAG59-1718, partial [uncultured Thermomicrobiales bacterium]